MFWLSSGWIPMLVHVVCKFANIVPLSPCSYFITLRIFFLSSPSCMIFTAGSWHFGEKKRGALGKCLRALKHHPGSVGVKNLLPRCRVFQFVADVRCLFVRHCHDFVFSQEIKPKRDHFPRPDLQPSPWQRSQWAVCHQSGNLKCTRSGRQWQLPLSAGFTPWSTPIGVKKWIKLR